MTKRKTPPPVAIATPTKKRVKPTAADIKIKRLEAALLQTQELHRERMQVQSEWHVAETNRIFYDRVKDYVVGELMAMSYRHSTAAVEMRRKYLELGYDHENLPSACAVTQRAGLAVQRLMTSIMNGEIVLENLK